jgi:hypothetical protein
LAFRSIGDRLALQHDDCASYPELLPLCTNGK